MSYLLLWIALIIAALDWLAIANDWRRVDYLAKPAVIVVLLAWLGTNNGLSNWTIWFGIGLLFSLVGDICLTLPRELFRAGLYSFLLTHVAYIIGFNHTLPPANVASLILAVLVGITTSQIYNTLAARLTRKGQDNLRNPILLYTVVISLMLLSALLTLVRPSWDALSAISASMGGLLFFISDSLIGWNRYVNVVPNGRLYVTITYHLGQICIIFGAALHYLV